MKGEAMTHTAFDAVNFLQERSFELSDGSEDFIIEHGQREPHSLSLQLLAGVGVFFASLFGFFLLATAGVVSFSFIPSFFLWCVVFVAAAIRIKRCNSYEGSLQYCFRAQISFVMMALGRLCFVVGSCSVLEGVLNTGWVISLAIALITWLTYKKYPVHADRFISSFAFFASVTLNIVDPVSSMKFAELFLLGWFFVQLLLTIYLAFGENVLGSMVPIRQALSLSLVITVFVLTSGCNVSQWSVTNPQYVYIVNVALVAVMFWCMAKLARSVNVLLSPPLSVASVGVLLLGCVTTPSILLSILLLAVGYAKHDRVLVGLGIVLLPVFIFVYYYNLKVSLLYKSGVLLASGIAALLGCIYVRCYVGDVGGKSCELH